MIARDDDHGTRRPWPAGDKVEQFADVLVGERHLAVVTVAGALTPIDAVMAQVEIVRVEKVCPKEKAARIVGRIAEQLLGKLFGLRRGDLSVRIRIEGDSGNDSPVVEAL